VVLGIAFLVRKLRINFELFVPYEKFDKYYGVDIVITLTLINIVFGLGLLGIS
jgi:hypothetical protein